MEIPRRELGGTGIKVSQLGFGCMRLPLLDKDNPESVDVPEAVRMIRRAVDAGVNYLDTAFPYHGSDRMKPGRSESVVGEALAGGYRERVVLATKLPLWALEKSGDMDRILDGQLERLRTDHVDFYLAHCVVSPVWGKAKDLGLFAFLDRARRDGRIRHPAFSFHDSPPLFSQVLGEYGWEMAQIQYNYLDVDYQAGRRGLLEAAGRGLGVVVMEPLRGGFLINGIPEDLRGELGSIRPEWSLADWALRWLWDQPEVGTVLSGMSAMEQVEENLRIAAAAGIGAFGAAERRGVGLAQARFAERAGAACTSCGYCLPCPAGVAIPKIFSAYNEYLLSDSSEVRTRARNFYAMTMAEAERGDKCLGCRACEEKCPQHLAIASLVAKAAGILAPSA